MDADALSRASSSNPTTKDKLADVFPSAEFIERASPEKPFISSSEEKEEGEGGGKKKREGNDASYVRDVVKNGLRRQ